MYAYICVPRACSVPQSSSSDKVWARVCSYLRIFKYFSMNNSYLHFFTQNICLYVCMYIYFHISPATAVKSHSELLEIVVKGEESTYIYMYTYIYIQKR